jgi:hypothetical protein
LVGHPLGRTKELNVEKKNVEKLQKAGILATPHALTPEETEVIESFTPEEINAWVSIKEKLETAGVQQLSAKTFI